MSTQYGEVSRKLCPDIRNGFERFDAYMEQFNHGEQPNATGFYNMKLVHYRNGTSELRTYSEAVGRKPMDMPEELLIAKQQVARIYNRLREYSHYNPFEDAVVNMYELDELELAEKRREHSLRNSYSRTIQKIYNCSRQCEWQYFITLTFAPDVVDRYDYGACMKKACKWFNNQRFRCASDMQYLIVPEQHKDGAWHVHGLLAQCDGMRLDDSGHKTSDGRTIYHLGDWDYGIDYIVEVLDTRKISGYITKYITKDLCAVTEGKRRYYRSRNIPEPQEIEFFVEGNEKEAFAELLADSVGMTKTYEKEIGGYTAVKYEYYERQGVENGRQHEKQGGCECSKGRRSV